MLCIVCSCSLQEEEEEEEEKEAVRPLKLNLNSCGIYYTVSLLLLQQAACFS
jgi:hypothetical protein